MYRATLGLVLLVTGCSQPLSPYGDLRGSWRAQTAVPGSSLTVQLRQSDGSVTGSGSYAIEAGRSGTISISGEVHPPLGDSPLGPTILLHISYDAGQARSFTGRLLDPAHMAGIITFDSLGGRADSLTLIRY